MSLSGLCWRNLDVLADDAWDIADAGSFGSFVVMSNAGPELPIAIHERYPEALIITRLYAPAGTLPTVEDFVKEASDHIGAVNHVCKLFQILCEPDLEYPGLTPEQFSEWFIAVYTMLKKLFPDCEFGFPMPSVNGDPAWTYAERCAEAIEAADFIAEHCYWEEGWQEDDWNWGSRYYKTHQRWPEKSLHITEYGCSADLAEEVRGLDYYYYVHTLPEYVISANAFWMAGGDGWPRLWIGRGLAKGITRQIALPPSDGLPGESHDGAKGGNMDESTRNRLWNDYMQFPALDRFRAAHPELGDPLEAVERNYGTYRVRFYAGGVIGCKVGDWDNIQIWNSKEDLPPLP